MSLLNNDGGTKLKSGDVSHQTLAAAIRVLAADAVEEAGAGHPGAPLGMADIAEVLWNSFLSHNPGNPDWSNRDRFVLSNGHASMLVYSLLYLSGYDITVEDLKAFRQLHSKTPGHPEYGETAGIETTTGPLGQGLANAVGMAAAEKMMGAQFNRAGFDIVDHKTYVFVGDGCLMEGVSHEACSLAGTLGLRKLVVFWDDNGISIDGEVSGWFTDDTAKRFESYGWNVIAGVAGHDANDITAAIKRSQLSDKPTLIACGTVIGKGAPNKEGSAASHGAPLGQRELQLMRKELDWEYGAFEIPQHIKQAWDATSEGKAREDRWDALFSAYERSFPELACEYRRRVTGQFPQGWGDLVDMFAKETASMAEDLSGRAASLRCLEKYSALLPELVGGSADLASSNCTLSSNSRSISRDADGNYIHFGVREFGMSAMINGICLHGGFKVFGATFLVFSDYAKNAIRMSALMKLPVIYVFTHDSIGLGTDGPTHQPIEQLASLRLIPNLSVWRPCDAFESAIAWRLALESTDKPFCLVFSRQTLINQPRSEDQIENALRGGYVLSDSSDGNPDLILIATGSEVALAVQSAVVLRGEGIAVRVVSMPSQDLFSEQSQRYQQQVLPSSAKRIAIEAGATVSWDKFVGLDGVVIGMDSFGKSGPADELFSHFGFTVDNIVNQARAMFI